MLDNEETTTTTENPATATTTPPTTTPPTKTPEVPPTTQSKTWSDTYVQELRDEAKTHRLAKKAIEAKLKKLIGLKDDEDIDDDKIAAFTNKQAQAISDAMAKANERLIKAEIKGLSGYDAKLIERLLDKSKITIDEDGTVKGLMEAVAELEKEFPQIKIGVQGESAANPPPKGQKTMAEEYQELLKLAQKDPTNSSLRAKLFMAKEKMKQ